jgi:4-oxalocrotonate tautomerase
LPIITVQQSPVPTKEQRQLLIKRITEAVEEVYELPPEAVTVFFQIYDDEHWGKAGKLRCDKE